MSRRTKAGALIFSLLLSIQAFSEKITVQQATEMALKNNKKIRIQMLEVEKSKIDVNRAWKNAYFSVDYTASANMFFKDVGGGNQAYTHSVTLAQPVYVGGAVKSGIKIGKEALDLAELGLEKVKKDIVLNTIQAYINVYDAQNMLEVYEASKDALDKTYEIQKEKYDLRMVTKPEILEIERSVKSMEASIVEQKSNIEITKETLGNLIGVKDSSKIEIVPFTVSDNFTKMIKLKDDLTRLKTENTEYQMALKGTAIAKENINIEKADLRPKVTGVINYGTLSSQNKLSNLAKTDRLNGTVGLNLSWNLFDWGARKLDVVKAQKEAEIKNLEAEQTLDDLEIGIKNVYYQLQSLEKSLEAQKIAVERAEEVYALEEERYSYRLITLNDLLTAESNLRQARAVYSSSRLNYYYLISRYGSFLD